MGSGVSFITLKIAVFRIIAALNRPGDGDTGRAFFNTAAPRARQQEGSSPVIQSGTKDTLRNKGPCGIRVSTAGAFLRALPSIAPGLALAALALTSAAPARAVEPAYLPVPPAARPYASLAPAQGAASPRGLMTINTSVLKRDYNVDLETGRVEIVEYLKIGEDSTALWSAHPEINTYAADTRDMLLSRRWLLEFIGKEESAPEQAFGTYVFDLPFRIPDWMRRVGVDKPKLTINGSYKLVTEGSRKSGTGVPYTSSWFPSLTIDQQPAFVVKGTIGRLITVEVNSEEGLSDNAQDQMKISYRGEGDELEDDIIQEIEAGNTSLSLTGTSLTGYTEEHKGLFGLKMRMKIGNLEVTTIASQEGGAQERQKLGAGTEAKEFPLEDKEADFYRHFWLSLADRAAYADPANWTGTVSAYTRDGANRRPVEVFRLISAGEPTLNADSAQACAYTDAAPPQVPQATVCVTGRWVLLEASEFTYDEEMRMLTVPGGHRDITLAARWENDPVQLNDPANEQVRSRGKKVLIYSRSHQDNPELDPLMWRNVYAIGKVSAQDRDNFRLDLIDNDGRRSPPSPNDSITYVRRLGLEKTDQKNVLAIDDPHIFKLDQGYLILPCLSNGLRTADAATSGDPANCLTPLKRVRPEIQIYETSLEEVQNGSSVARFLVVGKQRKSSFDVRENTFAAPGQQCYDINPGTERITLNGSTVLRKGTDYEVVYETGQITLTSARARDPNAELDISYECDPPFQIQDKVLLGTRMEYKLDNLSDQSLIGATVLYKSQTTTERQPELGYEPFSHVLMGMNTRLAGTPAWMTRFANLFPFVHTEARSRVNLEFEIAHSIYNPNTRNSAYVDNFDFSQNASTLPLTLYSWTAASPPLFGSDGRFDERLDYRHQGALVWHSSFTEQYYQIYGSTGNSYTNSREQTILRLQFQPNDNNEGNSWGGIMRAFPQGLSNHSRKRTLEVVVQGREGTLNVDLGRLSEDISIPGINTGAPDGRLQSEVNERLGDFNNEKDAGLDGVQNSSGGEIGVRWECKPSCYPVPVPAGSPDPGLDDFKEPVPGATEVSAAVNGTEGNNAGTGGVAYDTEDLNRNGSLDTLNRYLRYSMPLDSACSPRFHCEELRNGWRKYRIPLYGGGVRIDPSNTESEQSLLTNGQFIRLWLGSLPPRVPRATVQLARVSVGGNTWEEGARNTQYEVPGNIFCSGDQSDSTCIRVPPEVSDSNTLRVDVINRQEERGYRQSPNTPQERDTRTGEPLPERALVLRYEDLHAGEVVHATRVLAADKKDFTRYDRLSLEVHGDSTWVGGLNANQGKVSLGLRLGRDQGNRDSKDYYEIRLHLDTTASLDPQHAALWMKNSFTVRLSDLTGLKNDPLYRAFTGRSVSKPAWHQGRNDSSLTISITGNPTLGLIDWMRLVIYVDSGAVERQRGEIWVNDLRLEGVDKAAGTAIRSQIQLDFADFINISGNLQYTNGNFATLSQTKPTPAKATTKVDYNTNVSLFANKFLPDDWGVSIPITLTFNGALDRPFTRPESDLRLSGTGLFDIAGDLLDRKLSSVHNAEDSLRDIDERYARVYQTIAFERRFSVSYRKDMRSENFFTRALLERPTMEYRQAYSERTEYYRDTETRDYKYRLAYNLSPKRPPSWKPLDALKDAKYVPDFLSAMEISPVPERVNLVVADYSFVRDYASSKPRDENEIVQNLPARYTVDLSHGFDLGWKPLRQLNFGYRIDVSRDYNEDRECFDKESFFSRGCGGLFANDLIFAWDDARRGSGGYTSPTGIGFVDTTHLGDRYGILARERNRSQSFNADFNANPLSFLSTGASFNSGYRHTWNNTQQSVFAGSLQPAHFAASADHEIRLTSGFNPSSFFTSAGNIKPLARPAGAVRSTLDKWRVRAVDVTYTVSNKYNGEEFTYDYLRDKGVTFGSLLAYQFGFVYDPSSLGTIFEGVPHPEFFDYLSEPDPALGQTTGMNHVVNRSVDVQNGFTVPWVGLDLTGGLKYTKQYTLYRFFQASDTSVVWPEISVTGSFADFAKHVPILNKRLRALTASSSYNYREESRFSLFSPSPDVDRVAHRFAPLARFSATTNQDVRIELSFNAAHETEIQHGKDAGTMRVQPLTYRGDDEDYRAAYLRDPLKEAPKRTLAAGVEPVISWEVETQKGVQFWRYYIKLKNSLQLSLKSSCNYMRTEVEQNGEQYREVDKVNAQVRPEAKYNFTNNVDALFWGEYKYQQEFHTVDNEYIHDVALHGEFTMRF
jgi:hypothetical protein